MPSVFLAGTDGWSLRELVRLMTSRRALLYDIRLRRPGHQDTWSARNLSTVFGNRYVWVRWLALDPSRGSETKIIDLEQGVSLIKHQKEAVVLLCACALPSGCHRTMIGQRLRQENMLVEEVRSGPEAIQPRLEFEL